MERCKLPGGWRWTELARVAKIGAEQIVPSKHTSQLFNYLALENIEQVSGKVINFSPTRGNNIKSNKFKFTNQHVLYGKLRPYLRKAIAPEFEGISATDLLPLLPENGILDRHFLVWWLLSPQILEYVVAKQAGVKMPRLRSKDLEQMPLPLPPLPEQRRIVAKIESLFEQSRAARESLARVPQLMAQFRRAVLASAFRGELVEQDPNDEPASALLERIRVDRHRKWEEGLRAKGKDTARYSYQESAPPDTSDLPEVPEGWVWVTVREVAKFIQYGYTARSTPELNGPQYLRITDIQNGRVNWTIVPRCEITEDEMSKYLLEAGDILFARSGATAGKSYLVNDPPFSVFASYLIRVRTYSQVLPEFLSFYFNSQDYWNQLTTRGNAQPNANAQILATIKFPLAPLAEQRRIVAKIESMFAQAETIERAVSVALRRAAQIDQSILARAFRGELVETNTGG